MKKIISFILIVLMISSLLFSCGGAGGAQTDGESSKTSAPSQSVETPEELPSGVFVINITSRKFHLPDCTYAKKISSGNRETSSKTAEELLADGYIACGHCLSIRTDESSEPVASDTAQTPGESAPADSTEHSGDSTPADSADQPDVQWEKYVLNTNSKKIHKEDCTYAKKTSAENRSEYEGDPDELLDEGYVYCKVCLKDRG